MIRLCMNSNNSNRNNDVLSFIVLLSIICAYCGNILNDDRKSSCHNNNSCYYYGVQAFTSTPFGMIRPLSTTTTATTTTTTTAVPPITTQPLPLTMTDSNDNQRNTNNEPSTFREAEVLGLKFMQERKYQEALDAFQLGMTLPGSRTDIIRTKSLSGPSPVGGSMGGYESKVQMTLDEFEIQAVQYNMACAYAQLNNIDLSIQSLKTAFDNGFDNYATVRNDPDLDPIKNSEQYVQLMNQYDSNNNKKGTSSSTNAKSNNNNNGFNPFGIFGK